MLIPSTTTQSCGSFNSCSYSSSCCIKCLNTCCSSSHFSFNKNIEVTKVAVTPLAVTTVLVVTVPEVSVAAVAVAEVAVPRVTLSTEAVSTVAVPAPKRHNGAI